MDEKKKNQKDEGTKIGEEIKNQKRKMMFISLFD